MKTMKLVVIFLAINSLAISAGASTVDSWTQINVHGNNLTLNYTSSFNILKSDTLGISIKNVGNESLNDTITVNKINVSGTSTSKAEGNWTGSVMIIPNSSETIDFPLDVTTDEAVTLDIIIYYNVSAYPETLNVTAHYPGMQPAITSWSNNKTNDKSLTLTLNTNETVQFNFTANQALTSWLWVLNGNNITNPSETLTYTFNNEGSYIITANGSNTNGTTPDVAWNVTVMEKDDTKNNESILSWSPEVVSYVYVNDTVNETIEYIITTVESMTVNNWSIDGVPVTGSVNENTSSYTHTWDNSSIGFHTVIYRGNNTDSQVEFRWYVNVHEINGYGGGNLFDIIDDALENHATDIKIRIFKKKISNNGAGNSAFVAEKVNILHDEIAKRQMTREALRKEFKAGNITSEEYAAAIKQVQRNAKYNVKLAKGMAVIVKEDLNDDIFSKEFEKISEMEDVRGFSRNKSKEIRGASGMSGGKDKQVEDTEIKGKSTGKDKNKGQKKGNSQ